MPRWTEQEMLEELKVFIVSPWTTTIRLDASTAFVIASQLQVALRHPANKGQPAEVARAFCEELIGRIAPVEGTPIRECLELGFDPSYDG